MWTVIRFMKIHCIAYCFFDSYEPRRQYIAFDIVTEQFINYFIPIPSKQIISFLTILEGEKITYRSTSITN